MTGLLLLLNTNLSNQKVSHKMKLNNFASNQTQINLNDGTVILFSYKTPVAAYVPGQGYIQTSKKWSKTTSKHISSWLRSISVVGEIGRAHV